MSVCINQWINIKFSLTLFYLYRDVINIINSIFDIKTGTAKVEYPKKFAKKIRKMFNNDKTLYENALKQVIILLYYSLIILKIN